MFEWPRNLGGVKTNIASPSTERSIMLPAIADSLSGLGLRHGHVFAAHVHSDGPAVRAAFGIEHRHGVALVRPRANDAVEGRAIRRLVIDQSAMLERIVAQHKK